jgi:DNA-binding transcriptional ArsR family regulator
MNAQLQEEIALLHSHFCGGLADQSRMLLIYELAEQPRNVGELAERLKMAQPVVSRHLAILRERGIVTAEREGRAVYYRIADERIIQALDLFRAIITDQLHAQAQLVERVIIS